MKNKQRLLTVMTVIAFFSLVACSNSTDEANAKPENEESETSTNLKTEEKPATNEKSGETNKSESPENTQIKNKEETSKEPSTTEHDETSKSSNNNEITEGIRDAYLKELNKMEEADRNAEDTATMAELEEQEAARYKKWDEKLNEIYGVLNEQLDSEQMNQLREEQRNWIKHRDETAKESSLKYKGGSTETLEYVATQATMTRERCYALVAKYMN
nr:lysozyme inhibitor LprI family protein [Fredinandcohnia onubensis]